jgi:hypothetical protein
VGQHVRAELPEDGEKLDASIDPGLPILASVALAQQ